MMKGGWRRVSGREAGPARNATSFRMVTNIRERHSAGNRMAGAPHKENGAFSL
jgi:hypothetical protein